MYLKSGFGIRNAPKAIIAINGRWNQEPCLLCSWAQLNASPLWTPGRQVLPFGVSGPRARGMRRGGHGADPTRDVANSWGPKGEVGLDCSAVAGARFGDRSVLPGGSDGSEGPFLLRIPLQTWFSPYSLRHRLPFSPADTFPAWQPRVGVYKGQLKEHGCMRIKSSEYRFWGWGFPGTVSSYWARKSRQGQALKRS